MILQLKKISKKYGKNTILDDINLHVEKNEIISILGPTGCGKTTLLRIISGLEDPTEGEIHINNKPIHNKNTTTPPNKRNIGMVFQDTALWPHMTAKQNIKFALKDGEDHLNQLLNKLNLKNLQNRLPHTLSGGQKQCVAIARALAQKPLILLLDEPTANLDWQLKQQLLQLIKNLKQEFNISIIYVTHDQMEAYSIADRIAVINQGHIEQTGTPREIYEKPATKFTAEFIRISHILKELQNLMK